ncbi:exonuclease SbcCD subunit D [candidate division KSB1 bacterium]
MKIAVTADVHLRSRKEYPERYNALENILDQMNGENINVLVIAGDLFDTEVQNYAEFDELCKQSKYSSIQFYIIPGNHDSGIDSKYFTSENIRIFNDPEIIQPESPSPQLLFLPYVHDRSMGEIIAEYKSDLSENWILIGHGDFLSGIRTPNPYESGIYMPLSRSDILLYKPEKVFLGHIHKKMVSEKVHYPGSPCGLDISENGIRSFLIFDTVSLDVAERTVESDFIFLNGTLVALPIANEFDHLKNKIIKMINEWNINEADIPKARIRIKVKGYTSDKGRLQDEINESLSAYTFYNDEKPDLTEVSVFNDPEMIRIVEKAREKIENLEWNDGITCKEDILEQALYIILKD